MRPEQTDVVILCGGQGTRLRAVLADSPKPMAEIGGKPFLERLVEYVSGFGFRRFVFCVGYGASVIRSYFRKIRGLEAVFSEEPRPLGTGGALRYCEPLISSGAALVMNGDSFCPVDLRDLVSFQDRHGGMASLVLVEEESRRDGGFAALDPEGRIVSFAEKAEGGRGKYFNAGIYVFGRTVLRDFIPEGRAVSLEREVLPALMSGGVFGYPTRRPLYDIGTPERLERFRKAYPAVVCGQK